MKILFLSNGDLADYQCDTVFHGLRSLLGDDVVDYNRINHLYANYVDNGAQHHGKGFTIFGLLGSDANVDRTEIPEKLQKKYFDLVIYGSIQRCQFYFGGVVSIYPKNQVVTIDGEDSPYTFVLQDHVISFKRELGSPIDGFYPIHFGIPSCKILTGPPDKTRFMSEYDPLINRSYIYDTEKEYYAGYACSYFAPTMRKQGYDCMRHYEILGNYCIPYFRSVDGIPPTIMHRYPKKECDLVRRVIEYGSELQDTALDLYGRLIEPMMKITREKLTTEAVAKYLLDTVAAQK